MPFNPQRPTGSRMLSPSVTPRSARDEKRDKQDSPTVHVSLQGIQLLERSLEAIERQLVSTAAVPNQPNALVNQQPLHSKLHVDHLPQHIIVDLILPCLRVDELTSVELVARHWRSLALSDRIWRRLYWADFGVGQVDLETAPSASRDENDVVVVRAQPGLGALSMPIPDFLFYDAHEQHSPHAREEAFLFSPTRPAVARSSPKTPTYLHVDRAKYIDALKARCHRRQARFKYDELVQHHRELERRFRRFESFFVAVTVKVLIVAALCLLATIVLVHLVLVRRVRFMPWLIVSPTLVLCAYLICSVACAQFAFHKRDSPNSIFNHMWDGYVGMVKLPVFDVFRDDMTKLCICHLYCYSCMVSTCFVALKLSGRNVLWSQVFAPMFGALLVSLVGAVLCVAKHRVAMDWGHRGMLMLLFFVLPAHFLLLLFCLKFDEIVPMTHATMFMPLWVYGPLYILCVCAHAYHAVKNSADAKMEMFALVLIVVALVLPVIGFAYLLCYYSTYPGQLPETVQDINVLFSPMYLWLIVVLFVAHHFAGASIRIYRFEPVWLEDEIAKQSSIMHGLSSTSALDVARSVPPRPHRAAVVPDNRSHQSYDAEVASHDSGRDADNEAETSEDLEVLVVET